MTQTAQTQHTPGPWTMERRAGNQFIIGASVGYVAVVAPRPDANGRMGWESEVEQSNARLIAAAPDLLDFVKRVRVWATHSAASGLVDWHEVARMAEDLIGQADAARAAIRKATE